MVAKKRSKSKGAKRQSKARHPVKRRKTASYKLSKWEKMIVRNYSRKRITKHRAKAFKVFKKMVLGGSIGEPIRVKGRHYSTLHPLRIA